MDDVSPLGYLSFTSTIIICLTFSIVYVLGLYILSPSSHRYERNRSNVICRRILAVFIVCLLIYFSLKYMSNPNTNINTWLGFRTNITSIWTLLFYPILLTLILYLGPIIQWIDSSDFLYNWKCCLPYYNTNEQLIFIRNYIVAPFTEGKY